MSSRNNRRARRNPNDANVNNPKVQETPTVDPVEVTPEVESDVVESVAEVEASVEEPAEPAMDVVKEEPESIVIPEGPNAAEMLSEEVVKDMVDLKTPPTVQDIVDKKIQDVVKQTDEEILREDVPVAQAYDSYKKATADPEVQEAITAHDKEIVNDVAIPVPLAEESATETEAPAPDVDPEKPFAVVFTESMANRDERQIDIFRNRAEKVGVVFDEIESRRFAARVDALTFRRKLLAVGIKTRIAVYK